MLASSFFKGGKRMTVAKEMETFNQSFSGCDIVASIEMTLPNGERTTRVVGSLQTLTYSIHMDKKPIRSIGNVNAKDYIFGTRTIAGTMIFAVFNKHFAYEMLDNIREKAELGQYHLMMDELPPFDITVSFANEYGVTARLALYGVRVVSEGKTLSINDIYTENTYQFVATDIDYMTDATGFRSRETNKPGEKVPVSFEENKGQAEKGIIVESSSAPIYGVVSTDSMIKIERRR